MIGRRKTVLVVDDEHAVLELLERGLPQHLPDFDVVVARNGSEAIALLTEHPVDVVVTDVNMPIVDGFALIAHVGRTMPRLPVVVLSVMARAAVHRSVPTLGTMLVLRKPASPAVVARTVLEALDEAARSPHMDVPLATLLQLMRLEQKTCSLLIRSRDDKGRLHFLSGDLVNAHVVGLGINGDEAAQRLLTWQPVEVEFERSLHNHERHVHMALEELLLVAAAARGADGDAAAEPAELTASAESIASVEAAVSTAPTEPVESLAAAPAATAAPSLLERAAEELERSLTALRARAEGTRQLLEEVSPLLATATDEVTDGAVGDRSAGSAEPDWRDVAQLADQILLTADRLAAPPALAITPRDD
jgi:CheY-like chemotaxis protein